jgi:hypothetical protein
MWESADIIEGLEMNQKTSSGQIHKYLATSLLDRAADIY